MKNAEQTHHGPRIVEAFQDYSPPFNATKAVRRMLEIVPPKFLWGLHAIVLTNVSALSHKERERKTWGRQRVTLGEALGYYNEEWKGEPARITILMDNVEKRMGRNWLRWSIVRDIELSEVLFHELGHHIHRIHKPVYENKEDVADKWSQKFYSKFFRHRYWYLIPVLAPIALVMTVKKDVTKLMRKFRR